MKLKIYAVIDPSGIYEINHDIKWYLRLSILPILLLTVGVCSYIIAPDFYQLWISLFSLHIASSAIFPIGWCQKMNTKSSFSLCGTVMPETAKLNAAYAASLQLLICYK